MIGFKYVDGNSCSIPGNLNPLSSSPNSLCAASTSRDLESDGYLEIANVRSS